MYRAVPDSLKPTPNDVDVEWKNGGSSSLRLVDMLHNTQVCCLLSLFLDFSLETGYTYLSVMNYLACIRFLKFIDEKVYLPLNIQYFYPMNLQETLSFQDGWKQLDTLGSLNIGDQAVFQCTPRQSPPPFMSQSGGAPRLVYFHFFFV